MDNNSVAERPAYISELLDEISLCDEKMHSPKTPIATDEKVLGELSVWTRKVYALGRYYSKESNRLLLDLEDYDGDEEIKARSLMLSKKANILGDIFWYAASVDAKAFNYSHIGVRAGWQIVECRHDSDGSEGFKKFISGILGA